MRARVHPLALLAALVLVGMLLAIIVAVWRTPGGWLVVLVSFAVSFLVSLYNGRRAARAAREFAWRRPEDEQWRERWDVEERITRAVEDDVARDLDAQEGER